MVQWYEDPEYIKMCDCKEIQSQWDPKEGDCCVERGYIDLPLFLLEDVRGYGFITARCFVEDDFFVKEDSIWLPRQEDLQEMCNPREYSVWLSTDFQEWVESEAFKVGDTRNPNSMEQLWLAFVLAEKFNKYWDGSEWANGEWLTNNKTCDML